MADRMALRVNCELADKVVGGVQAGNINLPVGPISTLIPAKYWQYISKGILKSLLVEDEKSGNKLRDMIFPADIPVIVQAQTTTVYLHILQNLTDLGKKAVEDINPLVINVLVDWSGFDHFICHSPLTETDRTVNSEDVVSRNDDDDNDDEDDHNDNVNDIPFASSLPSTHNQQKESCQSLDENENFRWTPSSTKFLISEYKNNEHKFKSSAKKMVVWKQITSAMREHGYLVQSWHLVEKKWRNLKQHYKSIVDNNKKTGNNRKTWEYFDAMNDILVTDPAVIPPKTIGSMKNKEQINIDLSEEAKQQKIKERKKKTAGAPVWLESFINEQRNSDRERLDCLRRMHTEQMALLKEKNDLLKKIFTGTSHN